MFKIAWRYITSNKKDTMISILGITFSVMLMFSLIQMGDCVTAQFTKMVSAGLKRDFTVYDLSYEQMQEVEQLLEDEQVDAYLSLIYAGTDYSNGMQGIELFGFKGDAEYFKDTGLIEGNYPEQDYEICLEEGYNQSLHTPYKVGDTMEITIHDTESTKEVTKQFQISGILKNFVADNYHLWTTLETAEEIRTEFRDVDCTSNSVAVVINKSKYDLDGSSAVIERLTEMIDDFYLRHLLINYDKEKLYVEEEGGYRALSHVMKALTVILGIGMVIFIFNTYNIGVIRKIRQFGTMRCLGISRMQQNKIIVYESLIVGHIGILAGMILGNGMNHLFAEKIINALMMTDDKIAIHQTMVSYAQTYLLTTISIFLGIWKILYQCRKLTISEMLQFAEQKKLKRLKINQKQQGSMLWNLANRNLQRNGSKSFSLMITMLVSLLLSIVICSIFASIDIHKEQRVSDTFQYQIWSNTADDVYISEQEIEKIENLVGKENVCKSYLSREWEGRIETAERHIYILQYDESLFEVLWNSLFPEKADDGNAPYAILYSTAGNTAEEIKFVNVESKESIVVPVSVTVTEGEIFQQGDHADMELVLLINTKMAEQLDYQTDGWSTVWIKKNSETKKILENDLVQCLEEEKQIAVENLNKNRDKELWQLLGMVILAAYIMAATVLLTGIIISNTIQANLLNRRKEFGVMRALGMTKRKSIIICCMENGILFIEAYLIAAMLSIGILLPLGAVLESGITFSPIVYGGIAVLFLSMVESMSIKYMKHGLDHTIAEKLREE